MKFRLEFFKEHLLPALVCFGLAFAMARTEWLQRVENLTLDARTRLRSQFYPTLPRDEFALIGIDEPSLPIRGAHGEDERRRHGGLGGVPLVGGDEEDGDRHGRIPVLHEGYDEQPRCHTGRPKRRLQAGDRGVRLVQRCAPGASRAKSPGRTRLRCGNC